MINKKKVLLVCSPYYQNVTKNLIEGATKILKSNSVEYKILNVPGALEIAPAIKLVIDKSLKKPLFDGFVALGIIIKGDTPNFSLISQAITNGLMEIAITYRKPIGNAVLTCLNTKQAEQRSIKGKEAVEAILDVLQPQKEWYQKKQITVQGTVEKILKKILKEKVKLYGSGRTDSKVHAIEQSAHFDVKNKINNIKKFFNTLNFFLNGRFITVVKIKKRPLTFHARYSAKKRI